MLSAQLEKVEKEIERPGNGARASKAANAYSSPTWWYDLRGFCILTLSYRGTLGQQIRFFAQNLKQRHLEVAIGTGTLFEMILRRRRRSAPLPREITGIDYSARMLEGSQCKFRKHEEIKLRQADVTCMPFPDHSFDSVNIANALHCFSDVPGALREIRRVLAPGGTLAANILLHPEGGLAGRIANSINRWGMKKGILYSPLTVQEIEHQFSSAGYSIQSTVKEGNCLFVTAMTKFI